MKNNQTKFMFMFTNLNFFHFIYSRDRRNFRHEFAPLDEECDLMFDIEVITNSLGPVGGGQKPKYLNILQGFWDFLAKF